MHSMQPSTDEIQWNLSITAQHTKGILSEYAFTMDFSLMWEWSGAKGFDVAACSTHSKICAPIIREETVIVTHIHVLGLYIYILRLQLSVRPLRKVSGNDMTSRLQRLYLGPWCVGSQNQAISVNVSHGTSYRHKRELLGHWDRTINRRQWTLTCSGLQIAKQPDSREDIVVVIIIQVVDFALCFLASHMLLERQRAN